MIVTSRPAFRSASVSSGATSASYESMTSGSSGSESGKPGALKLASPPSPATPPQTEQYLASCPKGQFVQPSIIETDREADNDAATVRSPSMRTYREGDDHGLTGLAALSSREKPMHEARLSQSGMVPGPTRVTLRDEGPVEGKRDSEPSMGIQIKISDHEGTPDQAEAEKGSQVLENTTGASRYVEMLDVEVTPEQVATWLYGCPDRRRVVPSKPVFVSTNDPKTQRSSNSTSRFSRPFLKIATAWSASGSVKSPTSGPSSATSTASNRQIVLGQQLPLGTSMKTSRSKSSNAESNSTSPTGSTAGWRRSFLGGRPASRIQQRPKSMQIVSDVRAEQAGSGCFDDEEKRFIPAAREASRRFSMSGESDDNNLSDAAPSFASSMESACGFVKSGRARRPSSMLRRVSSAQRSFTSAASSVFLPTPREEKEESAFDFLSGIAPSSSSAGVVTPKDARLRTSSASKDGVSNRRFIKMLRRISGHGWKEDNQLRRVTSPEFQISDKKPSAGMNSSRGCVDMTRFPASFSSFGSGTDDTVCPPPLSTAITTLGEGDFPAPVMPASNLHHYSRSLTDVHLKSVDEEELPLPTSPGEKESEAIPGGVGRPEIQERCSSLEAVV